MVQPNVTLLYRFITRNCRKTIIILKWTEPFTDQIRIYRSEDTTTGKVSVYPDRSRFLPQPIQKFQRSTCTFNSQRMYKSYSYDSYTFTSSTYPQKQPTHWFYRPKSPNTYCFIFIVLSDHINTITLCEHINHNYHRAISISGNHI